jgi:hypothetical protein
MFVLIGLPMWLMTTTTYRTTLPFAEIDELAKQKEIKFQFKIKFISFDSDLVESLSSNIIKELTEELLRGQH